MIVGWKKDQGQVGKKLVSIEMASLADKPEFEDRFVLYQTTSSRSPIRISTMWTLWDRKTGTQHYLYGEEWEGARISAEKRISEILDPPPPKPRARARKKK